MIIILSAKQKRLTLNFSQLLEGLSRSLTSSMKRVLYLIGQTKLWSVFFFFFFYILIESYLRISLFVSLNRTKSAVQGKCQAPAYHSLFKLYYFPWSDNSCICSGGTKYKNNYENSLKKWTNNNKKWKKVKKKVSMRLLRWKCSVKCLASLKSAGVFTDIRLRNPR